jgi:hypothetical protein
VMPHEDGNYSIEEQHGPDELRVLAARVEAATGADVELDVRIHQIIAPDTPVLLDQGAIARDGKPARPVVRGVLRDFPLAGWTDWHSLALEFGAPAYTASLDAAVTLVPVGWKWSAILRDTPLGPNTGEGVVTNGKLHYTGEHRGWDVFAATPALALVAAALRALAEEAGDE